MNISDSISHFLRNNSSIFRRLEAHREKRHLRKIGMKASIERIYYENGWGSGESVSGPGSTLKQTENMRKELPGLLRTINAKVMLDVPCGDFHWMSQVDLPVTKYIGADIVPALIDENRKLVLQNPGAERHGIIRRDRTICLDLYGQLVIIENLTHTRVFHPIGHFLNLFD